MTREPDRPYISFGESDRPVADEHYGAVHLLVIDEVRRFADSLIDDLRKRAATYERLVAAEVMDRAYFTSLSGQLRLMGQAEVVQFLGLNSKQRLGQLRVAPSLKFPAPVAELRMGPVWMAQDIERWAPTWERKSGRPKKTKGQS